MKLKLSAIILSLAFLFLLPVRSQELPWLYRTLLTESQMDEIIGEASGETAWKTIVDLAAYSRDRLEGEYKDLFFESRIIRDRAELYGLQGVEVIRYPGGTTWDGISGDLWEISPNRGKIASYQDLTAMLAAGSRDADVTADLVWVGSGKEEDLEGKELKGRIVVTDGDARRVHEGACLKRGAAGVLAINRYRAWIDPLQMPWARISGKDGENARFAFLLPAREGDFLKRRLLRKEKITVQARVKSAEVAYETQDVVAHIQGSDRNAAEIILTAHLFEGLVKQSGNDNASGSAVILEVGRILQRLISEGRLPRPRRSIRFLWVPEFSGTIPWVKENKELMARTLCNINMDMVGLRLSRSNSSMCLFRTTYGNPHYINDVMENYYRYIGDITREKLHNRRYISSSKATRRITAPSGSDEPFRYCIETHFGSSDHEVFNDWGVRVPGIMMLTFPDYWFHSSGDHADKTDPTQLKRVAIIGAAAAYTIASDDNEMAGRIAVEAAGNAVRRLGIQSTRGMEEICNAGKDDLEDAYKRASFYLQSALENEYHTLDSVLQLMSNHDQAIQDLNPLKKTLRDQYKSERKLLKVRMKNRAEKLGIAPVRLKWTAEEKKAAGITPKLTSRVTAGGYGAYREWINKLPAETKKSLEFNRNNIASTGELQLLINGRRSVLEIRNNLDAQFEEKSELKDILLYLRLLEAAGLVKM